MASSKLWTMSWQWDLWSAEKQNQKQAKIIFNTQKSDRFWKNPGIDTLSFDLYGREENIFVANHSAVDWMFVSLQNSYLEGQPPMWWC